MFDNNLIENIQTQFILIILFACYFIKVFNKVDSLTRVKQIYRIR